MRCVKPNLLRGCVRKHWNVEELNIPALEWAGRGSNEGDYHYEFIGKYDALMALGCAQGYMLVVGKSGRKSGPGYQTQRYVNDRFRLELRTNDLDIDAVMARAKTIS